MKEDPESISSIIARVHREISPHMGNLCIALEQKRVKPTMLDAWVRCLKRGADDLERLAIRLREGKKDALDSPDHNK